VARPEPPRDELGDRHLAQDPLLNASKKDLFKDLTRPSSSTRARSVKKLYENEFGTAGGEPYGALIGDYEFTNHPDDIELLRTCRTSPPAPSPRSSRPPAPQMFGFNELGPSSASRATSPRSSRRRSTPSGARSAKARTRASSTWCCRARCPACPTASHTKPIEEFGYEEVEQDEGGVAKGSKHDQYCWMNAAYAMGVVLTRAFAESGWCTAIRGAEGGGKVENLPTHVFTSDDGDSDAKCPTEIGITDRREAELSNLGFLPLCHYKNTDYAVFFGAQTHAEAEEVRLAGRHRQRGHLRAPAVHHGHQRFAHYLKVMARDKIGSFMEAPDCEKWLNNWIQNYVNGNCDSGQELKAKYPLRRRASR
jgi:type VI secretion system protein ImpC